MGQWSARYLGGGVRVSRDDKDHVEVEIGLSDLRREIDDRIIANLCRALAGIDRLAALAHLAMLNDKLPEGESDQRERNLHTIALTVFGTMREIARVLSALRAAGIEGLLSNPAPWHRLDKVRKRWLKEASIQMRNGVAFHLCFKEEDAVRGLKNFALGHDRTVLTRYQGSRLIDGRHPIGDEILFAAAALEENDIVQIMTNAPQDGAQLAVDLEAIAGELLRRCGARF